MSNVPVCISVAIILLPIMYILLFREVGKIVDEITQEHLPFLQTLKKTILKFGLIFAFLAMVGFIVWVNSNIDNLGIVDPIPTVKTVWEITLMPTPRPTCQLGCFWP